MTMGAFTLPLATISLNFKPALARSPYPSQQMREGNPWNGTFSRAIFSQRWRCASSGKSSMMASSVR